MTNNLRYNSFKKAALLSLFIGVLLITISMVIGKDEFFLLLNSNLGPAADFFFHYCTYLGDGILWVPIGLYFIAFKRKLLPLVLSTIIIGTLFVQLSKQVILPNRPRPIKAIANTSLIHTVQDVEVHENNSFPSGHTTTVFSIFLVGCLVISANWFLPVGLLIALLTGYSRIYLAQHFPLDVGAGIIAGVVSVYVSFLIQNRLFDRREKSHEFEPLRNS